MTTSSLGSLPDFPEPNQSTAADSNRRSVNLGPPRASANLGPPPSSRRGASSFYSHASFVSPIPEEMRPCLKAGQQILGQSVPRITTRQTTRVRIPRMTSFMMRANWSAAQASVREESPQLLLPNHSLWSPITALHHHRFSLSTREPAILMLQQALPTPFLWRRRRHLRKTLMTALAPTLSWVHMLLPAPPTCQKYQCRRQHLHLSLIVDFRLFDDPQSWTLKQ
ncbi:hypothetical protein LB505_006984 [Fusarium chuoi]|nr:hypothetical protein LB505_006984 [Fusarium chuoi]